MISSIDISSIYISSDFIEFVESCSFICSLPYGGGISNGEGGHSGCSFDICFTLWFSLDPLARFRWRPWDEWCFLLRREGFANRDAKSLGVMIPIFLFVPFVFVNTQWKHRLLGSLSCISVICSKNRLYHPEGREKKYDISLCETYQINRKGVHRGGTNKRGSAHKYTSAWTTYGNV